VAGVRGTYCTTLGPTANTEQSSGLQDAASTNPPMGYHPTHLNCTWLPAQIAMPMGNAHGKLVAASS
jgi:hypothetical protein